ncbi:MAG: hypothetical protein HKN94_09545 [Acidimicrobiales bacterium]|nr:type II secretion system F family protein [Acidimicrobiia bacterium]NNC80380.1 hypothetical protein [Acidimicrobiales bacterium]
MIRLIAASVLLFFVGTTLVLSEIRWFRARSLATLISPYLPGGRRNRASELFSMESFGELLRPAAQAIGGLAARLFGVSEELPRRLRRVHWEMDAAGFRLRQMGWAVLAMAVAALAVFTLGVPAPLAVMALLSAPVLAFLVVEQQLANASDRWKHRVFQELPIVAEQIAMLLGSGYSLGAALNRIADRGNGAIATDLKRVVGRVRQGASEGEALREWSDLVDVDQAQRLVSVLSLNKEAGDLGGMVATEARTTRAEAHRALLEDIERKNQQVWIPVTLATLVPGVILMAIPFFDALQSFG